MNWLSIAIRIHYIKHYHLQGGIRTRSAGVTRAITARLVSTGHVTRVPAGSTSGCTTFLRISRGSSLSLMAVGIVGRYLTM